MVIQRLRKLRSSEIEYTENIIPQLQDILNQIDDKQTFKRSIKGMAYGRGGAMQFPNFILKHLK